MQTTKRIVKDWLVAAALAAILCAGTINAHAQNHVAPGNHVQPVPHRQIGAPITGLTDAQVLAHWDAVTASCRAMPPDNPACLTRDDYYRQLVEHGWTLANHDVWYSSYQITVVAGTASGLQQIQSHLKPQINLLTYARTFMTENGMTDAAFIAIWNDKRGEVQAQAPFAWAILSEIAGIISREHPNDPRYALDSE